jgi:outer membrane immunogenic protein
MRRLSPGLLALFAVAASAVATAAMAADMPTPGPAPAYTPPAYRPVLYDWTGIYIGGNVGGGWMNDTVTMTTTTVMFPAGTSTKIGPMGVIGGAQAGFNIEFSPVVLGFEGTWDATNMSGNKTIPTASAAAGITGTSAQITTAANWYATATARLGFAANDFLFYAKGGGAWMRANDTQAIINGGGIFSQQSITSTRSGYTVGAGVEFGMTENLSAKLEYDYLNFGTHTYNFNGLVSGAATPLVQPFTDKASVQMVTFGINYRFNWGGGGAVPAK